MNDPVRHQETLDSIRNADDKQLNEYASMCFAAGHPGIEQPAAEEPPPAPRPPAARPAARNPAAPPAPAPQP